MTTTTAVKPVNWTQTPEGRRKLSKMMKDRHKAGVFKKAMTKVMKARHGNGTASSKEDVLISYALGHVTAWLEIYCKSHGVSRSVTAYRVGKALQDSARREVLGSQN